jgi:hypothetical protein
LVPNFDSNPSVVRVSDGAETPALLISRSIGPSQPAANARTESRLARSSARTSVTPGVAAAAALPFSVLRTAKTTRAPVAASAWAAAWPMPLLAPVTIAVVPVRSGMSATVKVVIGNNVDRGYFVVNDYIGC